MSQLSNHGHNQLATLLTDPWTQALMSGALTLIPVRKYPKWLRKGLIWGPSVLGSVGGVYFAFNPEARQKLMARIADTGQALPIESDQLQDGRLVTDPARRLSIIGVGSAAGAAGSLVMSFGFWADEAIDQGLQRMKVPFPRVVMGLATGALIWWQETTASGTRV